MRRSRRVRGSYTGHLPSGVILVYIIRETCVLLHYLPPVQRFPVILAPIAASEQTCWLFPVSDSSSVDYNTENCSASDC